MASILVVDDNRANREALASLLEIAGHSVSKAPAARQGLAAARAQPPDLVISDVLMPGMDGYVLARELRKDPATSTIPVIFYTAYFAGQDAKQLAQAHGVARVLVKPSDNDVILRTVQEVLDERIARPAVGVAELGGEHLRIVVDQLLEKTGTLEAQQRRIERLNRTLETLSAVNALIVRVSERDDLLAEACRIAVERGGFGFAAIRLADHGKVVSSGEGSKDPRIDQFPVPPEATVCNDIEAER
jgi:CheY-like chemotaxis protein